MNNQDAIARGMDALERGNRITVTRAKAKANTFATDEAKAEAQADADAWNALRHLKTIM
jgi:hypothetical protein